MRFRNAVAADASSLAALSMEVWVGTYLRKGISSFFADYALAEFTAARFQAVIEAEDDVLIVSENDDGIDGFIRVAFDSPSPGPDGSRTEIKTLYVQPRHHGKGIGKGLLKEALAACGARGCGSVWLAVNSENTAALTFYLANGFQSVSQTHFRIADQAYLNEVMSRQLP